MREREIERELPVHHSSGTHEKKNVLETEELEKEMIAVSRNAVSSESCLLTFQLLFSAF